MQTKSDSQSMRRLFGRWVCLVGLLWCASTEAQTATAQPVLLREGVIGTWALQSIYEENDYGDDLDRWGNYPRGYFIADQSGHFVLQLTGRDVIRLGNGSAPLALCTASDREVLGYSGTYTVDPERPILTLQIEDATLREWDGRRPTVDVAIVDDVLHFTSGVSMPLTGSSYAHLVWKRTSTSKPHS